MEEEYREFEVTLNNGEKCKVRYCDEWGCSLFGNRTVHFEFRDCLSISFTKYRSEFRTVAKDFKFDPKDAAMQIIEQLTGIRLNGKNVQQKLL